MAKRHTQQDTKQALGQYFTTNADQILAGWGDVVAGKKVIDPFAGAGDLIAWAQRHQAISTLGFDLHPLDSITEQRDSLVNPPDFSGAVVVTNPPYLSANKCRGDKSVFTQWNASDYYKCHLAALAEAEEAIEIVPANFLCERRPAARDRLFATHHLVRAKIWTEPTFDDTTTSICALHLRRGKRDVQRFPLEFLPGNTVADVTLSTDYGWLWGNDFFSYINVKPITVIKTDQGMPPPNTRIVVGLLDNGAAPVGLSFNAGNPIYCSPKSFTTYQITLPDVTLTDDQQNQAINLFNQKLTAFRTQYQSMFLANFMGPGQKILSRDYVQRLLTRCLQDLGFIATSTWDKLFE